MKTFASILAISALALTACATGNAGENRTNQADGQAVMDSVINYPCDAIKEVNVGLGMSVTIRQDSIESPDKVEIHAPESLMRILNVELDGDELKIGYGHRENTNIQGTPSIEITIHSLEEVTATTAASVHIVNSLYVRDIELKALTSATLRVDEIHAVELSAQAYTGAALNISGECREADLKAFTGATLDASQLSALRGSAKALTGATVSCSIENPDEIESLTGGSVNNR